MKAREPLLGKWRYIFRQLLAADANNNIGMEPSRT